MRRVILQLVVLIALGACSSKSEQAGVLDYSAGENDKAMVMDYSAAENDKAMVMEEEIALAEDVELSDGKPGAEQGLQPAKQVNPKKIIKTGSLSMNVANLAREKSRVDSLVARFRAYYDNEQLSNSDYQSQYTLTVRVPVDQFEEFLTAVEQGGGDVNFKNIDARDVTEEFIDLETRQVNKRKYMERYVQLLQQAKKVEEILAIQEKIRAIEEEIESVTGRLNYLSNQVGYSTLELMLVQKKEFRFTPGKRAGFFEKVKESVLRGWFGFIDFFYLLLRMWVYLLVAVVLVVVWKKFRRRKSGKEK